MAKFFTLDEGKTYYNADQVLKIVKATPNLPDTNVIFVGGEVAQSKLSIVEVVNILRTAE